MNNFARTTITTTVTVLAMSGLLASGAEAGAHDAGRSRSGCHLTQEEVSNWGETSTHLAQACVQDAYTVLDHPSTPLPAVGRGRRQLGRDQRPPAAGLHVWQQVTRHPEPSAGSGCRHPRRCPPDVGPAPATTHLAWADGPPPRGSTRSRSPATGPIHDATTRESPRSSWREM